MLIAIGFGMFALGLGYLFYPKIILRLNAYMRDTFFKDSVVHLSNRRVGTVLLLISFVLIAMRLVGRH